MKDWTERNPNDIHYCLQTNQLIDSVPNLRSRLIPALKDFVLPIPVSAAFVEQNHLTLNKKLHETPEKGLSK